jgi:hypothetical protein
LRVTAPPCVPASPQGLIGTGFSINPSKLIKVKLAAQSDAQRRCQAGGARNSGATRRKKAQLYRNRTAIRPAKLHQIAPNCTKLHLKQKHERKEKQAGGKMAARKSLFLFFCLHLLPAKWQRHPASWR